MYKANRDKKEALAERDNAVTEATRVKKMKEEAEKAMGEVVEAKNKLQSEVEGKCVCCLLVCRVEENAGTESKGDGAVCKSVKNIQGNA